MSMPEIFPIKNPREQAITDIIASVALEQTALSHILYAEGDKIKKVVANTNSEIPMLAVNKSAQSMVNAISRLELVLQSKLELFADCLCCDGHRD